ncbi:MAG TPA: saccharopine dehydrogenase NADP-binding domain-containing protein [Phototrophicaceae bacterium]|jgi:homospermidine synthase|nr:saccharopine dehydrogenase NADP-binding domain-containing protein [Phototrophicaceae bacterium]
MQIPFGGRVLLLGCGSVSRCLQPLLLKHMAMDFSKFTIMDFTDQRELIPDTLAAGVNYVQDQITPDNMAQMLGQYLGAGDLLIDLAWNIDCGEIIQWCHDHDVLYVNTSVELWDPYNTDLPPSERTLYVRHMALRERASKWTKPGATAVVEHGANPGLVSHWTKVALEDIAKAMLTQGVSPTKHPALEKALAAQNYPLLAMIEGVKVIHISERDTQISNQPKRVNEFVNTWSIEGFREEGIAPAEMGWGTHERRLPNGAQKHTYGPGNQICLSQPGMNTFVRSWVPKGGEVVGMVVRHGEAFTISDYLTVWEADKPVYRPTVHYAYQPADAAIVSLHELRQRNYEIQTDQRIMNDDIIDGDDELGVLLLGHDLNGWWVGSQLSIHETRDLVKGQNATTLQVAASVLGAVSWMVKNPQMGLNVPDNLPYKDVLEMATPYLGPCPSLQTDWTPLKHRFDPFIGFSGNRRLTEDEMWQFESFLLW